LFTDNYLDKTCWHDNDFDSQQKTPTGTELKQSWFTYKNIFYSQMKTMVRTERFHGIFIL